MNRAILLDRDGTLNVDHGYVYRQDEFEWIAGVPQALKQLAEAGFLLIVISNQSGIARGYYSLDDLSVLEQYMNNTLEEYGVVIDGYYYCPHTDADNCKCRKPGTLMVEKAMKDFNINPHDSWMIGDRVRDLKSAEPFGFNLMGVTSSENAHEFEGTEYPVAPSLAECVEIILRNCQA